MEIREARSSDAAAIQKLYQEVMGYAYPLERMKEMIEKNREDPCNFAFTVWSGEELVAVMEAVIKYSIHRDPYLIINTLAVAQRRQGMGIGTQMLAYAESFARQRQLACLRLGSQMKRIRAHHFYEMNHFHLIKEHKIFERPCQKK